MATNYLPGSIISIDDTDYTSYTNLAYQLGQQGMMQAKTNTANLGLGQLGQAFGGILVSQAPIKKVMSFIEELRKEISDWHGSLGVI